MNDTHYVNGITVQNLRAFLELWAQMMPAIEETKQTIIEGNNVFFDEDTNSFSWCHLYELPVEQHINFNFPGLLPEEQVVDWRNRVAESPGKIAALPNVSDQVNEHFNARADPTEEDIKALRPFLFALCAYFYSMQYSLFCILYHGCFLNDLIARVRSGDDKALFDAIRIDSTIIGCKSIIERISQAKRLKDDNFLWNLKMP